MTARHSPLFTLESGQSGLGFYTSQRDAAWLTDVEIAMLEAIGKHRKVRFNDQIVKSLIESEYNSLKRK